MRVFQVFGCGIRRNTFKAHYENLSEEEQHRLERVARRIWLTLKLRYETAFYRNPFVPRSEDYSLDYVELPSIRVYLLCTCLDTIAGKHKHVDFDQWLKSQSGVTGLDIDGMTKLYKQYKEEHGTGKNLRSLFENLPQSARNWLENNVILRRSNLYSTVSDQDKRQLVKRLYIFFYEIWRNPFTHSSISRQVLSADDVREPTESDDQWLVPAAFMYFPLRSDRPNQKWSLSYRQGLDLETILYVIIYATALQGLKIEVSKELITKNIRNLSRLNALYACVGEVNDNAATMSALSELEVRSTSEMVAYLIYGGIPLLQEEASKSILERYDTRIPFEAGMHKMTKQYLAEIEGLNREISRFNKSNPPPEGPKDNPPERWQNIKGFLGELAESSPYGSIVGWPTKVEMENIWLIIRDPCYNDGEPIAVRA